jgi:tRNA (cytidine56-2'-O)-methyltransferase
MKVMGASVELLNVVVLRWGHRYRDKRLTTHVALTARALGASGFILADVKDQKIKGKIESVTEEWGGSFWVQMGMPWRSVVKEWREHGGVVVHLTAYGENLQTSDVLQRIKATGRAVLIIVGSKKVPSEFFSESVSDYNVAIGNQPHSECAALAIFLDKLFEGEELSWEFKHAKIKIVSQPRGKKISVI